MTALRHKIALFYTLITILCLTAFILVVSHSLGYRINRSSSLPDLVYRISPLGEDERIKPGDCVVIDISRISGNPVIAMGIERGYIGNQPMLKRIGAVPGDKVELRDGLLFVNGAATEMTAASQDSNGRILEAYSTPITLPPEWYWLVSDPKRGFDSRYFGPVRRGAFTHRAEPLF
jgi:conjugative transfer signal peptidase TraF